MKAIIITKVAVIASIVTEVKNKTDLLIVRLTNLKAYTTVESFIISMA